MTITDGRYIETGQCIEAALGDFTEGDLRKWRIRKKNGVWEVARPHQAKSVVTFDSFRELLYWNPDCVVFLKGWCWCRDECRR